MRIISRYVVGAYLRVFVLCMAAATGLMVVVDFFTRVGDFATYNSGAAPIITYFIFKLPKILTQIYPAAALLAVLASIGSLVRNNELLALRSAGLSTARVAIPVLLTSLAITAVVLVWNDTVVPPSAGRAHAVKDIDIKMMRTRGLFNSRSLWMQASRGFLNIEYYDANHKVVYGVSLHEMDPSFQLQRIIKIPRAVWTGRGWEATEGTVRSFEAGGVSKLRPLVPGEFELSGRPAEFRRKQKRSDEFSYRELAAHIRLLQARGLSSDKFRVDLQAKLAMPFAGLITVLVGIPLALRGGKHMGVLYSAGLAMVVSFAYWSTLALSMSAGHTGKLPPTLAAWLANGLFAAIGVMLYPSSD